MLYKSLQEVHWTTNTQATFAQHVGINHGRFNIFMPQELLNSTDIVFSFQQMSSERMSEGMAAYCERGWIFWSSEYM